MPLRAFLLLFLAVTPAALAGWARAYSGVMSPRSREIVATRDGGFLLTTQQGDAQSMLIKVDAAGEVLWSREIARTMNVTFAAELRDGDLLVGGTGHTGASGEVRVMGWLGRFAPDGTLRSSRYLATQQYPIVFAGAAATDGGAVLVGTLRGGTFIARVDAAGAIAWQTFVNASGRDHLDAVRRTRDGGFVIAGYANQAWIGLRLDAGGKVRWQRAFGLSGGTAYDVSETRDGGFVFVGRTREGSSPYRMLIVKTDAEGKVLWQRKTSGDRNDVAYSVAELKNGNLLVSGSTESFAVRSGTTDLLLLELTAAGAPVRSRVHGIGATPNDLPANVVPARIVALADGGFVATAAARNRIHILRFDASWSTGNACSLVAEKALQINSADGVPSAPALEMSPGAFTAEEGSPALKPIEVRPFLSLCDPNEEAAFRGAAGAKPEAAAVTPRIAAARATEQAEKALEAEILRHLAAKRFDQLDALADRFRTSREHFRPAKAKLESFYDAVVRRETGQQLGGEDAHVAILEQWMAARPQSVTAPIALAGTLTEQAWRARGSTVASSVTDSAWARFRERNQRALDVLSRAEKQSSADPHFFVIWLSATEGEEGLAVVSRVSETWAYPRVFTVAANFALPQWGGSVAELGAIMDLAAAKAKGAAGDGIQVLAAFDFMLLARPDGETGRAEIMREWSRRWPAIREAFRRYITAAPNDAKMPHRFALMAQRMGDRATARTLFRSDDLAWSEFAGEVWKRPEDHDNAKTWALGTPDLPVIEGRAPWLSRGGLMLRFDAPAAEWPKLVAVDRQKNRAGFVVEDGPRVVAISLAGGFLSLSEVVASSGFAGGEQIVAYDMTRKRDAVPGVQALKPRKRKLTMERVFVVGEQTVEAGMVRGSGPTEFTIEFDAKPPALQPGSPVVDEDGRAAGMIVETKDRTARALLLPAM